MADPLSGVVMPIIRVEMLEGRSIEQKRDFAQQVTQLAVDVLKCKPDTLHVVFSEVPRDAWSTAGVMQSDRS
jgi:4-oxalocrotonate tautomerase